MSIPRAKIRLGFYVPMASWECALLDVPCGTAVPVYWSECPECGYSDDWWTWDLAANDALSHLRDAHGVRTVGSLTANDIGKWVEMEWHLLKINRLTRYADSVWVEGLNADGLGQGFSRPPSTPCRVTEEHP